MSSDNFSKIVYIRDGDVPADRPIARLTTLASQFHPSRQMPTQLAAAAPSVSRWISSYSSPAWGVGSARGSDPEHEAAGQGTHRPCRAGPFNGPEVFIA